MTRRCAKNIENICLKSRLDFGSVHYLITVITADAHT